MERFTRSHEHQSWEAWNRVIHPLIRIGRSSSAEPNLPSLYDALDAQACAVEGLRNWRPTREDGRRLFWAALEMEYALDPKRSEEAHRNAESSLLAQLRGDALHWTQLRVMAESYLRGYRADKKRPPSSTAAGGNREASRRSVRLPGFQSVSKARDIFRTQALALRSPADFYPKHERFTVYLDESFFETDPNRRSEAVLAGLVWAELSFDYSTLPWVPNHLHEESPEEVKEAVNRLLECKRCFPFIMHIDTPGPDARSYYDDLVHTVLKLLLGWIIPRRATVRILIEQREHLAGRNRTEYYQGVFQGTSWRSRDRYSQWTLKEVAVTGKDPEYIGYAHLLAYLPTTTSRKGLKEWSGYADLPGYVHFRLELVRLLERLDEPDSLLDAEAILSCIALVARTNLASAVLSEIAKKFAGQDDARRRLLEALEERFKQKDRDLSTLSIQLQSLQDYVFTQGPPPFATTRLRLLWAVLQLQQANHAGDPTAVDATVTAYLELRDEAFRKDPSLVAHVDCNLSVHYCDRFDFLAAERTLLRLWQDPAFVGFDLLQKAVIESSLGQVKAMQGADARVFFETALRLLEDADLSDDGRRREMLQTGAYAAFNALDGDFEDSIELVERVTGPLPDAALQFSKSGAAPYNHHLFLRCVYLRGAKPEENAELTSVKELYLQQLDKWQTGSHHPWELIELYRALLLYEITDDEAARSHFRRAIGLAQGGATLELIKAMIGTIAHYCYGDDFDSDTIHEPLQRVESELAGIPAAESALSQLRAIWAAADISEYNVEDILNVLPFNYH